MRASRLRRAGAWYLDFSLWGSGMAMLGTATGTSDLSLVASLLVFLPLRALTARLGVIPA